MKFLSLKYVAFLAACLTLSLSSCNNDDEDVNPANEIAITAPTANAIVNSGQTVNITGTIKGKKELHGYEITVRRKADNAVLFTKEVDVHSANITFNETWTVDAVTDHQELELEVIATLDHDGNSINQKMTLHALPAGQDNFAIINITSPTEGAMVTANQTLNITGTIDGLETVHGFKLRIRANGDTAVIFKKDVHVHAADITIAETWVVPAVTGHTPLELEVIATLDHDGNSISKKVNFHAMP
jgi:hypothetical protein